MQNSRGRSNRIWDTKANIVHHKVMQITAASSIDSTVTPILTSSMSERSSFLFGSGNTQWFILGETTTSEGPKDVSDPPKDIGQKVVSSSKQCYHSNKFKHIFWKAFPDSSARICSALVVLFSQSSILLNKTEALWTIHYHQTVFARTLRMLMNSVSDRRWR